MTDASATGAGNLANLGDVGDLGNAGDLRDSRQFIDPPPLTGRGPRRLLVMLHGAGSSAGAIVPAAIAWQLKLRSAEAFLLQAPFSRSPTSRYWTDPAEYPVRPAAIEAAADEARDHIAARQKALGIKTGNTLVVGFSQGASVALELAFGEMPCAAITIGYSARLYRLPRADDRVQGRIHLLHGGADSVVPAAYGEMAYRRLRAMGAKVSLDLLPEEGHAVGQMLINRGTQHAMNWLFDRSPASPPAGSAH
jgi:phospholipase/carboxylesterase